MIDLLYQRYFQYKEWEESAVNIGMTCRNVYRLHGRALLSVENKIKLSLNNYHIIIMDINPKKN